jgi:hypothetical protein
MWRIGPKLLRNRDPFISLALLSKPELLRNRDEAWEHESAPGKEIHAQHLHMNLQRRDRSSWYLQMRT